MVLGLPPQRHMRVLPWRPRRDPRVTEVVLQSLAAAPGSYSGRARFKPRSEPLVDLGLRPLIGHVIDLQFVRIAGLEEPFGGQALFRRWPGQGPLVAEQDLDFSL